MQNYLSFKDEVVFSFEATSDSSLKDFYIYEPVPGVRLLKLAMVYGANASGKSNLISAFDFIRKFVFNIVENKEEEIGFDAFQFDETKDKPGKFELTFYVGKTKYVYALALDNNCVYKEVLTYYPSVRPAILFERSYDFISNTSVIQFGAKLKISKVALEEIIVKTLKNSSVFASYSQVNISLPELDEAYNWFRNQFMNSIDPYTSLTSYSDTHIQENKKIKEFALDFIKEADFNITDILFEEKKLNISDEMLKLFATAPISESEKERINKERVVQLKKTMFEHKVIRNGKEEYYQLPAELQSQGTMRYYGLSAPFYNAIMNNAFLPIDEIGSALHPLLVMHFIRDFLKKSKSAQLLFTTHNMSLLNEKDILRRDAIWLTDKGKNGATELNSVADFPDFRKELSYYNYYKQGKFGAIPNL